FIKISPHKLTALYAASAIFIFYWYASMVLAETLTQRSQPLVCLDSAHARSVARVSFRMADLEKGRGFPSARGSSHRGTLGRSRYSEGHQKGAYGLARGDVRGWCPRRRHARAIATCHY